MVPSAIVLLPEMPKTSNGKINRKELPDHRSIVNETAAAWRLPETENERVIARIWEVFLDHPPVLITDNFFQIGGESILVIRMRNMLFGKGEFYSTKCISTT